MNVVLLSDLHLGYRVYQRVAPSGVNVREIDVAQSFTRAVDRIIALAPDLVVVGGDTFHQPRPSNAAIVHAHNQFSRLARGTGADVVVIGGNHDQIRSSDGGDILPILATIDRVHVVGRTPQRIRLPHRQCSVFAVPDAPGVTHPEFAPDPDAEFNVLVCHGEVRGSRQSADRRARADGEIDASELASNGWDFCGFGHFHEYEQVGPNAYYSGSLDFVSSNPWKEIGTPKGFIEHDLTTGEHRFHVLEPSRRYVDLPPIDAHGMGAEQLDTAIRDAAESAGDLTGCVVRLIVEGVSRELGRALDQRNLKAVRRGTLNFQIDLRRPAYVESALSMMVRGVDQPGARVKTVEDRTREKLESRELAPDVDRGDLITMAMKYLAEAKEKDLPRAVEEQPDLIPAAPRTEAA